MPLPQRDSEGRDASLRMAGRFVRCRGQPRRSRSQPDTSAIGTRCWSIESRSRIVTALSSSVSKSIVTQNGVPI